MANYTLNRADLFPAGTTVGAYPASSHRKGEGIPSGAATESQAVAAGGTASFVALVADTDYVFYAKVSGQDRFVKARVGKTATGATSIRGSLGEAVGTCTTTSGSAALTVVTPTTGAFSIGQTITGAGIPAGTRLIAGSGASWTMSANATASASSVPITAYGGNTWAAKIKGRRVAIGTI